MTDLDPAWQEWSRRRPDAQVTHLDTAAAGRSSLAVRQAVADFARREAEVGAYVAEAEAAERCIWLVWGSAASAVSLTTEERACPDHRCRWFPPAWPRCGRSRSAAPAVWPASPPRL